jgi:hypothetical protein
MRTKRNFESAEVEEVVSAVLVVAEDAVVEEDAVDVVDGDVADGPSDLDTIIIPCTPTPHT